MKKRENIKLQRWNIKERIKFTKLSFLMLVISVISGLKSPKVNSTSPGPSLPKNSIEKIIAENTNLTKNSFDPKLK